MAAAKTGKVPAVERAFAALELLAESKGGLSMSAVAHRLQAPKSSIHLIMRTLEDQGYLWKDQTSRKYFIGLRFIDLAGAAGSRGFELRERSKHLLLNLTRKLGLTVDMGVLEGSQAVLIEVVQSPGVAKLDTWVGHRMDLNCTALGKALLAFVSEGEFERIFQGKRLVRHNQNTICSIRKLRDELSKVRAAGYAVNHEEEEIGICSVGAPVFDHSGQVVAAISVDGTTAELAEDSIDKVAESVRDTAERISRSLGYGIRL